MWDHDTETSTLSLKAILGLALNKISGSIAAATQSRIGGAKGGSVFASLQSYGAGGPARATIRKGQIWIVVSVLVAAVGKMLMENGIPGWHR